MDGGARLRLDAQKKTLVARERDRPEVQAKRKAFVEQQPTLKSSKLVFLDESGFRLGTPPHYGWAPVGEKSPGKAIHGQWTTMTMIGAIALDGWRGFLTINAPTDGDVFLAFGNPAVNNCGSGFPTALLYNPATNPGGIRCGVH